ncbi:MAG: DUF1109 family protein [Myxococcales bacterium]|nr:DUF1109 family protein [Myxococcales bacterium]
MRNVPDEVVTGRLERHIYISEVSMSPNKEAAIGGKDPEFEAPYPEQIPLSEDELQTLISDVESELRQERGGFSYLRCLPSSLRVGLGLGVSALVVAVVSIWLPRTDLSEVFLARLLIILGVLGILLGASVWYGLHPLHRPPLPRGYDKLLVVVSLVSLVVLAYWPLAIPMPSKPDDWGHAVPCLFMGTLFGLPVYLVLRLLDRGGRPIAAFLAAASAALAANGALALFCDNTSIGHVLRGHASVGFLFVGTLVLWRVVVGQLLER